MKMNKKYVMIVTSEDERYGRNGVQLDFFWDNPLYVDKIIDKTG